MTVCALFGDYDTPDNNLEHIYDILLWLVIVCDVDFFYVGTEGNFDETAEIALFNLCSEKPHVGYNQVFADEKYECLYPTRLSKKPLYPSADEEDTAEEASIKKINRLMIDKADCVLLYTLKNDSEISALKEYAAKKGKKVHFVHTKAVPPVSQK